MNITNNKMKILLIGFSVGGVMGDGIKILASYFSKQNEVILLTNKQLDISSTERLNVIKVMFNKNRIMDFFNPLSYYKIYKTIKCSKYDVAFIYNGHPVNFFVTKIIDLNRTVAFLHDPIPHSRIEKEP